MITKMKFNHRLKTFLIGVLLVAGAVAALSLPWQSQAVVSSCRRDDPTCAEQEKLKTELQRKGDNLLKGLKQKVDSLLSDAERNTSEVKTDVLDAFETYKQSLWKLYEESKKSFFALQKGARLLNQASFGQLLDAEYQDKVRWADFAIKLALQADAEEKKTHRIVTKLRKINQQLRAMSDLVGNIREELDRLNSKLPCTSKTCI